MPRGRRKEYSEKDARLVKELAKQGKSIKEIEELTKIPHSTVHRLLKGGEVADKADKAVAASGEEFEFVKSGETGEILLSRPVAWRPEVITFYNLLVRAGKINPRLIKFHDFVNQYVLEHLYDKHGFGLGLLRFPVEGLTDYPLHSEKLKPVVGEVLMPAEKEKEEKEKKDVKERIRELQATVLDQLHIKQLQNMIEGKKEIDLDAILKYRLLSETLTPRTGRDEIAELRAELRELRTLLTTLSQGEEGRGLLEVCRMALGAKEKAEEAAGHYAAEIDKLRREFYEKEIARLREEVKPITDAVKKTVVEEVVKKLEAAPTDSEDLKKIKMITGVIEKGFETVGAKIAGAFAEGLREGVKERLAKSAPPESVKSG